MANAFMGTSSVKMLRDATGGEEDIPKKIKMAIRTSYFDYSQAFTLTIAGMMIAFGISAILYVYAFEVVEFSLACGGASLGKSAYFMLGMTLAGYLGAIQTRGNYLCNPKKKGVEKAGKAGRPCLDDLDCSNTDPPLYGSCTHPSKHAGIAWFRDILLKGGPLAAIILAIGYSQSDERSVSPVEIWTAISIGMGSGIVYMMIAS
jgi:hypothetical protein